MKVSELTLDALRPFITGDDAPVEYMSGPKIVNFFNLFGIKDEYSKDGLPGNVSRNEYARITLGKVNGKPEFKLLIEALVDSRKVENPDEIVDFIREFIKHTGII